MSKIDEQVGARWHGDNGAWVYSQCCAQAGQVVDADVVCQCREVTHEQG